MTPVLLDAEGVSARRGDRIVLEPFDLSLAAGERVAIYGPNGAGKSTMLQVLAGLLPIASGRVSFRGETLGREVSLLEYHRRTAAVFQEPLLLRGTVRHNVELGLKLRGADGPQRRARAQNWLERLRIAHLAGRSAGSLSGGEAQRASLARALALDPEVFFLDEPFAALDAPTRGRLTEELSEILDERRIATLFVTHDFDEAVQLCARCVVLDAGRVLQHGEMAAVSERPACQRVAEIIGAPNLFEGRVTERGASETWLDWNGHRIVSSIATRSATNVRFMIRQAHIRLQDPGVEQCNRIPGRIEQLRRRGSIYLVAVGVGNLHRIQVISSAGEHFALGQEVALCFPPYAVWIFPREAGGPDALYL